MSKDWSTELWELFVEIDDIKDANDLQRTGVLNITNLTISRY